MEDYPKWVNNLVYFLAGKMEDYPKWVNNLVYFLAGIGFGHLLFNFIF